MCSLQKFVFSWNQCHRNVLLQRRCSLLSDQIQTLSRHSEQLRRLGFEDVKSQPVFLFSDR
jgi:hypothetical protein